MVMVVVRNRGDFFCTGADMQALLPEIDKADGGMSHDYFREEYALNRLIFHYPKPYISLLNGWVRGDGIGLSLFGSIRVASDKTQVVMSETDLGFIADGGATYFLSRFLGRTGWYVGLSGAVLSPTDAVYVGIATHYVGADRILKLEEQLLAGGFSAQNTAAELAEILKVYQQPASGSHVEAARAEIDRCFAGQTIEEILYALSEGTSEWHKATLGRMLRASPTSLKATLRLIQAGRRLDFDTALMLEFRVSQYMLHEHDLKEGIRSHLVAGDHKPRWVPDLPEAVSTAKIDRFFEPRPEGELAFL